MLPLYKTLTPTKKTNIRSRNNFLSTTDLDEKDENIFEGEVRTTTAGGIRQRKTKLTVMSGSDDTPATSLSNSNQSPSKRRNKVQRASKFNKLVDWIIDTFKVFSLFLLLLTGFYITLRTDFTPSKTSVTSPATNSVASTPNETVTQHIKEHKQPIRLEFQCRDGNGVGVFNDDYCDCSDGSDEPYTSACSNILVHNATYPCSRGVSKENNQETLIWIYPSRIKDGIIDCPDGSDEIVMIS
jgi:hypothetical protein